MRVNLPRNSVEDALRADAQTYRKNVETAYELRQLQRDRVTQELHMRDAMGRKPRPQKLEALMAKAWELEDKGNLVAAIDAYGKVLAAPEELDNHGLRRHIAQLMARINKKGAAEKAAAREAQLEEEQGAASARAAALRPEARPHKPVGPMMPMPQDVYRAELAAQAMEVRRRREAERREAEALEQRVLAEAEAEAARAAHAQHVVGRNDRLSYQQELDRERRAKQEERRRRFYTDWDELCAARVTPPGGPLAGVDEYARQREQAHAAHTHRTLERAAARGPPDPRAQYHDAYSHEAAVLAEEAAAWAAVDRHGQHHHQQQQLLHLQHADRHYYPAPGSTGPEALGYRQRPASAGATIAAAAAARERAAAGASILQRAAAGGAGPMHAGTAAAAVRRPASAAAAGRTAVPTTAAVRGPKTTAAPFGLEQAAAPIDLAVVKARQLAFIAKRRKPAPPTPPPQVPLRARRAAGRTPSPPRRVAATDAA